MIAIWSNKENDDFWLVGKGMTIEELKLAAERREVGNIIVWREINLGYRLEIEGVMAHEDGFVTAYVIAGN